MFGEPGLDGIGSATARSTAHEIRNGDAESLAGFDVVVAGEVGIGENKNAWTHRGVVGFAELYRGTSEQAPKLHLEERQSRRQTGVAGTAAQTYAARFRDWFDRQRWNCAAVRDAGRLGFGGFSIDDRRQPPARR